MSDQAPNLLWIGRMIFGRGYRVREIELARRIAGRAPVFALDHTDVMAGVPLVLADKLRMRLKLCRSPFEVLEEGTLTRFRMPLALATGPTWAGAAAAYNERRLGQALQRFQCRHVYLSTPFFFMPPAERDYRLHYDVIDNFHDQWPNARTGRARRAFHTEQLRRADSVSASSLQLCDYVHRLTGRQAVYIPNGADLASLRAVPAADAQAVRERYGLQGRFVLGFIGNHTMPFYGLERIVRAFVGARESRPDLALLVVGPGGERALEYCRGEADGVYITGAVAPEQVGAYFHACDAGVHPYDPRPQTHDAMALNVIEFSACGKPVLSNPLREFERLALPNVRFTDGPAVRDWQAALCDPASFAPFDQQTLEHVIEPFDWDRSANLLAGAMGLPGAAKPVAAAPDNRVQGVVHFQRKPAGDFHSIEKLFRAIRLAMAGQAGVREAECPEVSSGLFKRLRNLRWAKAEAGAVNHITGDAHYLALRLPGARTILTVHDCVALQKGGALRRAILRKLYFQWPVKRAAIVTTISDTTRAELARVTGRDSASFRVIPDCVADAFIHYPGIFTAQCPTVLLVGTLPHKNLERVAQALKPIPCRLRIVGRLTGQQRELLTGFGLDYTAEHDLTTAQMVQTYRDCDIVGFASLYEGFGMPILEGQATGRVVVTSNLSSMPEVAGTGACLVDPNDVESIRAGFTRVIGDAKYREELIIAGLHNAAQYRPARIAAMYLELYRELGATAGS